MPSKICSCICGTRAAWPRCFQAVMAAVAAAALSCRQRRRRRQQMPAHHSRAPGRALLAAIADPASSAMPAVAARSFLRLSSTLAKTSLAPPAARRVLAAHRQIRAMATADAGGKDAVTARARAAVLGSLLADAATMPLHWICEHWVQPGCRHGCSSYRGVCVASIQGCGATATATALWAADVCLPPRSVAPCTHTMPMAAASTAPFCESQTMPTRCRACWTVRDVRASPSSSLSPPAPSTHMASAACRPTVRVHVDNNAWHCCCPPAHKLRARVCCCSSVLGSLLPNGEAAAGHSFNGLSRTVMASHASCLSVCTLPSGAQAFAHYHKLAGDEEYALLQYGTEHADIDGPGLMQASAAD